MTETVPDWLADPGSSRLWSAVRNRLERNGLTATGSVTIAELTREERHAIGGLLGRTIVSERVSVNLAALDVDLQQRSGIGGLVAVLEAVTGTALVSRPAARTARAAQREAPFIAARDWLRLHQPPTASWLEPWLASLRRSGVLTNVPDGPRQICQALQVLTTVIERQATQTRTALAATAVGDAHALDEGTLLAHVILRGLAIAADEPSPQTTRERRELWERFGVSADAVSSTCLVLGLRAHGSDGAAARLNAAADDGDPIHLTGWDLRHLDIFRTEPCVFVFENPAVLEAAAERFGGSVPLVCSSGQPALVVVEVLRRLTGSGAELRYHGDFDWPGIAIANRLVGQVGVRPWMMNTTDYRAAAPAAGLALTGAAIETPWDRELGHAMQQVGLAVHEEAVLDRILDALVRRPAV
jgi:uncharacterized protein (TIGR02679 family)